MDASTTTYLQIVNASILEAGVSLASFAVDGSDFNTSDNAMMNRFKGWVSRAWKDIQQQDYAWEWLQEQGIVQLTPGIMFYTDGTVASTFLNFLANGTVPLNIYDASTDTIAIPNVTFFGGLDLTGVYTVEQPYFYLNFSDTDATTPLQIALKPSAEYLPLYTHNATYTASSFTGTPQPGDNVFIAIIGGAYAGSYSAILDNFNTGSKLTSVDSESEELGQIFSGNYNGATALVLDGPSATYTITVNLPTTFTASTFLEGQAFVHSWKSFDFSEEVATTDFQESIQEINPTSFRLIDYYAAAPSGEQPLQFIPWEQFREPYDNSAATPGLPRLITQDDTGRYRLYPAPYYKIAVKFEYARKPQILTDFDDVPHGISDDFVDLIMWKTIDYWSAYDKQADDSLRARREYNNLLSRLNQKDVNKFRFKSGLNL